MLTKLEPEKKRGYQIVRTFLSYVVENYLNGTG